MVSNYPFILRIYYISFIGPCHPSLHHLWKPIGIIYSGSAGRTGIDANSPKFDGDTLTYGASITKLLSATCIMQLVEQGKISLDDNMRPLVPELDKMQILREFTAEGQPVLEDNPRPITLK